jgi:hypothetical protein
MTQPAEMRRLAAEACRWSRGRGPDQSTPIFIANMRIGKQNFFPKICEIVVIQVEATCDGPIGHTPLALD